ncbi:DUF2807 domain-containing protein [Sphingomonas sp.]|uniref:GIN domain-containing protein n=1 Tax=Sphingomonas sp. TaxID=28214 RepID=UPI001B286BF6|nr:DUF2807 domain-containing protein [Sphingomonas sp.]MBO9712406.1 DUF2807 domain-containing protein [Sphingomonas sp.]
MRRLLPLILLLAAAPAGDQRSFIVSGFDRLRVDGPFEVAVVPGSSPDAHAEGTRDALDRVQVRTDGTTLVVSAGTLGWEVRARDAITLPKVTVVAPSLRSVLITGGGKVDVAELKGQRVEATVNGAGSLSIANVDAESFSGSLTGGGSILVSGKAGQANFNSLGFGSIDASGLIAGDLVVRSNSTGGGHYAARFTARVTAMATGSVRVEGQPKCFLSGTGPISCGDNSNVERR